MTIKSIYLQLLIMLLLLIKTNSKCPFPKTIWMYWNQPEPQLPLVPKLCFQQILKYAALSYFKVVLLHEKNLDKYITKIEQFREIVRMSKHNFQANYADFIRLTILQEHGGIWIDITTILVQDLQWLNNLQGQRRYLSNKYGNSKHDPDALIFYNPIYGYRVEKDDQYIYNFNNVNQLPGYESWFIGAKKGAQIIREWRNKFIDYYLKQYQQVAYDFTSKQIYISHLGNSLYFRVFYALYYTIQQKQKELDRKLTLFSENRENANVYYKLWGLNCRLGPCLTYMGFLGVWGGMSRDTLQELKLKHYQVKYFAKLQHVSSENSKIVIEQQIALYKQNITLRQSFQRQPWYQSCTQINYIVENSVMGKLVMENTKQKIKIQSIAQRNAWNQYCQDIEHKKNHQSIIKQYIYEYFQYFIFFILICKYAKSKSIRRNGILDINIKANLKNQQYQEYQSYINSQSSFKKLICCHLSNLILTFVFYITIDFAIYVDFRNVKNQLFKSYLIIAVCLGLDYIAINSQSYIKYQTYFFNNKSKIQSIYLVILEQLCKINDSLRYFGYLSLAKICTNLVENRQQNLILFSIYLGLICPCVLQLSYKLAANDKSSLIYKQIINLIKGKPRIIIIISLSWFNFFPGSLYLIADESEIYTMRSLLFISFGFSCMVGLMLVYELFKSRSRLNKCIVNYYKKRIVLLLLAGNCIWLYSYVYYVRLINQLIRFNFQFMYIIFFVFLFGNLSNKKLTYNKLQQLKQKKQVRQQIVDQQRVENNQNQIRSSLQDFGLGFMVIFNCLTPLQYYFNKYDIQSEQSRKTVNLINSCVEYFVYKIAYIYLMFIVIQFAKKSIKICKSNNKNR